MRMDMRHGSACDFRLVSSYVPFVATITRAQVFIGVAFLVAPHVPVHVCAALLLLATYFDALVHEGVCSSSLGGHLWPICFAAITRLLGQPNVKHAPDALLAANVIWYAVVHALLASYTFRRRVPVGVAVILTANAVFVVCCLWLSVGSMSMLEMHLRSVGFYVFVFIHFYVFQTRSQWDTATHACIGPHIGMHMLLADTRFVLLSVCCAIFMCVRVYLQNQDHHDSEVSPVVSRELGAPKDTALDVENMAELLQELLAAKAVAQES
jgi:hypothetical protein